MPLPSPTFADPQGFAIGVLSMKDLASQDVYIAQWRFRYGTLFREFPFEEHKDVDGQFMTADGITSEGWYPGDHKGCCAAGTVVSGPAPTGTFLRWYEGQLVDLATASGKFLTVTPNHPILTGEGWIAAGLLDEGRYVVRCTDAERAANLIPDDYQAPAMIEQVVESFGVPFVVVPVAAEDFHGDGRGSEICVIRTDSALMRDDDAQLVKMLREPSFSRADSADVAFGRERTTTTRSESVGPIALSLEGERCKAATLGGTTSGRKDGLSFRHGSKFDAESVPEPCRNQVATDAESLGKSLDGLAGVVELDELVSVRHRFSRCHVYNLQTSVGWYVGNDILVHNCLCWEDPVFRQAKGPDDVEGFEEE